jgi:hypothetical protein
MTEQDWAPPLNDREVRSPSLRGEWISFWITLGILSVLGAFVSLFIGGVLVMGSDGCGSESTRFLCTGFGQQTVFLLPWAGWLAAIVLSLATAAAASRRQGSPWLGILIGGLVYVVSVAVAYSIATP